jgi:DNA-binding CsgD family transcriptional regulator
VLAADPEPSPQRARALWACGWLAVEQGDLVAAESRLAEARALADRLGDEPAAAWGVALSGYAALFAGDLDRARPLLEEGLARQRARDDPLGMIAAMSGLAQTLSYLGDPASETISRQVLALSDEHQVRISVTSAKRNLGLELLRQGRVDEATVHLQEALAAARRGHGHGVPNCLDFLAWAAQGGGEPGRAARLLGSARAAYRRIGATMPRPQLACSERYAGEIRRALSDRAFDAAYRDGEQLNLPEAISFALGEDAAPAAAPAEPSPLTRRERQVAALVARGLTAREIAAELVISPRTAESHVANILTKLGLSSRTQIAAWHASYRD